MSRLLSMAVIALITVGAYTQNRTMFIHHDGTVDPIFYAEIDSMRVSSIALDSTRTPLPSVQEIWTSDSIYRFEIASIDSITFQTPRPVALPDVVDLAGELAPYIEECRYYGEDETPSGYRIRLDLKAGTPADLIPLAGTCLYQADPSEKLPCGFSGKVAYTDPSDNHVCLWCESVEPETMFETLSWTSDTEFQPEQTENGPRRITLPTLGSDLNYPDLIEGAIIMTEELKDIPAGPERAQIKGRLRITPTVRTYVGHYAFKKEDGSYIRRRRLFTSIRADVSATVNGRENAEEATTVNDRGNKVTFDFPIGFGTGGSLTYSGAMTVKGKMGLVYRLECSCESSALTDITIHESDFGEGYHDIYGEHTATHKKMEIPIHRLEASMDGEASLTGNISVTAFKTADFEGTVTNTFSYGARLKGSALFLNSETDKAATDNSLFQRITSTGVTASPVNAVSGSAKYLDMTYKKSLKSQPVTDVTFYAVPCLSSPSYDESSGTIRFNVHGIPMSFAKARLGAAVMHNDGSYTWNSSNYVWPDNVRSEYDTEVTYKQADNESIYPTVTLPGGKRILASPAYPTVGNQMLPITSFLENSGVIVTGGSPFTGSAVSGNHGIYVGTIIPIFHRNTP